jgi:ribose-phosphate pyrophosphokinase
MITSFDIVSGGVHPELAKQVAKTLNKKLIKVELKLFSNGERYVRYEESVRQKNLFIIQSFSDINGYSVNDAFMELLLLIDAAKRASANEISVVLPYFPYSRQDRKARNREPISTSVIISCLQRIGVSRIITVDLHSAQTQAIFDGPFDHIIARPIIVDTIKKIVSGNEKEYIIVSPDAGRAKDSESYANELGVDVVHLPKIRDRKDSSIISRPNIPQDVKGRICLVIDDMIDTGGTILSAVDSIYAAGAKDVIVFATHGILSNNSAEKFKKSKLSRLYLTNTLPQNENLLVLKSKLKIMDMSPIISKAIRRIAKGESLSFLFDGLNAK